MSEKIYKHLLDDVLAAISQVEPLIAKQMGGIVGCGYLKHSQANVYRRAGKWLLREDYLDRLIKTPYLRQEHVFIPGFPRSKKLVFDLWMIRYRGKRYVINAAPQAIMVQSSVRNFYLSDSPNPQWVFSAKIAMNGVRGAQAMRTDIQVREQFARLELTGFPKVFYSRLESEPLFFCEEVIPGRTPHPARDCDVICNQVIPQLGELYQKYGVRFQPVQAAYDIELLQQSIATAMQEISWNATWMAQNAFSSAIKAFVTGKKLIPCSIGHGDLGKSNVLIASDGRTYIIDWETACEMPVICDLSRLTRRVPSLPANQAIADVLSSLVTASEYREEQVFKLEEQLLVATLNEIHRYVYLPGFRKHLGDDKWKHKLTVMFNQANDLLTSVKTS